MDRGGTSEDPLIGSVIDERYEVLGLIGEGGMGVVYSARHVRSGRKLALKCLHAPISARKDMIRRFEREARAEALLGDPHVVEVVDFGSLPTGAPYMVMERLAGRDLDAEVEELEQLPVDRAVHIVVQAAETIDRMHAEGVIHRDLKPDNLFLTDRPGHPDFVKLLDFGIASMRRPEELDMTQLTADGTLMGTPAYMSPEQAEGQATDARTDIYALGAILYFALSGAPPFSAPSLPLLIVQVTSAPRPDVCERRADVPRGLSDVLLKAMARDPQDRFASARELARALAPFRTTQATDALGGPAPDRGRWKWVAGAGVAAAATLSLGLGLRSALVEQAPAAPERLPAMEIVAAPQRPAAASAELGPAPAVVREPEPMLEEAPPVLSKRPTRVAGTGKRSKAGAAPGTAGDEASPQPAVVPAPRPPSAQPEPLPASPLIEASRTKPEGVLAPRSAKGLAPPVVPPPAGALLPPANDIKRTR